MTRAKTDIRVRHKGPHKTQTPASLLAEIERLEAEAERLKKEALRLLHKPVKERDTRRILRAWCRSLDLKQEARQLRLKASDNISGVQRPEQG